MPLYTYASAPALWFLPDARSPDPSGGWLTDPVADGLVDPEAEALGEAEADADRVPLGIGLAVPFDEVGVVAGEDGAGEAPVDGAQAPSRAVDPSTSAVRRFISTPPSCHCVETPIPRPRGHPLRCACDRSGTD